MSSPPPEIIEQLHPAENLALFCGVHKAYNALFARQFPTQESLDALQSRHPELFDWNAEPPEEWVELVKEEEEVDQETAATSAGAEADEPLPDDPIPPAEEKTETEEAAVEEAAPADPVAEQLRAEAESAQSESDAPAPPAAAEDSPPKRATRAHPRRKRAPAPTAPPTKKRKPSPARAKHADPSPPTKRLRGRPKSSGKRKAAQKGEYEVLSLQPWKPLIVFCVYEQLRRRLARVWGPARRRWLPKTELDELDFDKLVIDCARVRSRGDVWFIDREVGRRGWLRRNLRVGKRERWREGLKL